MSRRRPGCATCPLDPLAERAVEARETQYLVFVRLAFERCDLAAQFLNLRLLFLYGFAEIGDAHRPSPEAVSRPDSSQLAVAVYSLPTKTGLSCIVRELHAG